ncbi:MAG: hypothetical protein QXU58_00385 [Pyrobaculum sp.]
MYVFNNREELKKALREIGGQIWFYIDLEPFRTVYTLTICGEGLCVLISGQDMSPVQLSIEDYMRMEDDIEKIRSLLYTINYLETILKTSHRVEAF